MSDEGDEEAEEELGPYLGVSSTHLYPIQLISAVINRVMMSRPATAACWILHGVVVRPHPDRYAGRSGLVVIASDCGVSGPGFESHRVRLCLSRQPLRYTALVTSFAPLTQCLDPLSVGR